jgi:polyisoprenyl-teichoic acid--peptidoglycan teichoic acid transferase
MVTQSGQDVSPAAGDTPPAGPRAGSRAQTWYRVSMIVGIVLVVLSGLVVGGVEIANRYFASKIPQEHLIPPAQQGADITGPINILMLGMDERTGETDLIHADSVIILHVNADHDHGYLVSVPRDSMVAVPAYPPSKFPGTTAAKLTEAFAFGNRTFNAKGGEIGDDSPAGRARGVELLATVLNNLTPGGGLKFNAVGILSFDGFTKLVQAMGGVDNMCVDELTLSEHYDNKGNYVSETHGNPKVAKTYPVGCYHMEPWEALDFVRQRKYLANGDGDYGRQRHQQQFLLTVFKQLYSKKTLTDVSKITGIMDAAGQLLTVDLGGHSPLDWVFTLQNIKSDSLTKICTNGCNNPNPYRSITINGTDYEQVTPDLKSLLGAIKNDTVDQFLLAHPTWGSATTSASPSPAATSSAPHA